MAKTVIGLEITEQSVRGAEVSLGRKPQLLSYGEVPLPPEAARDSEVIDSGTVAVALRQLWTGARFKSREAVLGLASRRILVREYTTQAMRPDLLREALPFQVQDLLPVPATQAVLDFFPLSQEGDQVSGLLVAAVAENVEHIISTLSKVKVRARAIDLSAFGLARITAPLARPEDTVATVFIGEHTTQVVVARSGVPQFVRILPIDVATSATQTQGAGEPAYAYARARDEAAPTRGAMRATMPPGASDLANRVRSTLAFFGGRPNAQRLTQIYVSGAGATAEGVLAALNAAVDAPLTVVSVGDVIPVSGAVPPSEIGLNLVCTVGIATGEAGR